MTRKQKTVLATEYGGNTKNHSEKTMHRHFKVITLGNQLHYHLLKNTIRKNNIELY